MSENTNPLNDFLNMQEETPTMFGGFAFPPVTPDAVPTAPAQNPSVPAQPVPQAVPQAVEQPVAYTETPPVPQTVPQQVPQQPVAPAAAPAQGSLFQAAMAQTPAGQQPVMQPVAQPTAAPPEPQPAPKPAPAPNPAPEIANAPDPLSAALAKAKQQGDARLVEACATRDAMFVYGKAKDPITDRDCTFEDLREKYEADFPELAESKKVEWSVTYADGQNGVEQPSISEELLNHPIDSLGLSVRAYNCLLRAGCERVGDAVRLSEDQIQRMRNLGAKSANEIACAIRDLGIPNTRWSTYIL